MGTGCGDAKGGGFLKLQALVTLELAGIITAKYVIQLLINICIGTNYCIQVMVVLMSTIT